VEQAEEAAQETFVRAFFGLNKLRTAESFFSWLLGIGNRVASEQQRTQRRHRRAIETSPRPSATVENNHDDALQQALADLPEKYAQVVLLRYYGGLTCPQVAERLGVPLGTVTKRLSRAYAMLRQSLRQYETDQERSEVQP
jgi:RNA polymerase sigma-70 factor (ECF subfamily)